MKIEHDTYDDDRHEWTLRIRNYPLLTVYWERAGTDWGWSIERIDGGRSIGICARRVLITFG